MITLPPAPLQPLHAQHRAPGELTPRLPLVVLLSVPRSPFSPDKWLRPPPGSSPPWPTTSPWSLDHTSTRARARGTRWCHPPPLPWLAADSGEAPPHPEDAD